MVKGCGHNAIEISTMTMMITLISLATTMMTTIVVVAKIEIVMMPPRAPLLEVMDQSQRQAHARTLQDDLGALFTAL